MLVFVFFFSRFKTEIFVGVGLLTQVVVEGQVLNVTSFLSEHPGGWGEVDILVELRGVLKSLLIISCYKGVEPKIWEN